jgi:hypothetical protein
MSDDFVKIGTTFDTDGFVEGKAISAFQIAPADLVKACAAAAEPGLPMPRLWPADPGPPRGP